MYFVLVPWWGPVPRGGGARGPAMSHLMYNTFSPTEFPVGIMHAPSSTRNPLPTPMGDDF